MKFSKKSWKSWFFAKIVIFCKNREKCEKIVIFRKKSEIFGKFCENFVMMMKIFGKFCDKKKFLRWKKNFSCENFVLMMKILIFGVKNRKILWKIGKFCEKSENFLKNRKILNFQKFWKNDEKSRFWGHFGSKKPEKWPFFGFSTFDNFDNFLVVSWTPKSIKIDKKGGVRGGAYPPPPARDPKKSIKIDKNRVFSHFFRDLVFCVFGVKNAPRGWLSEFRGWLSRISD